MRLAGKHIPPVSSPTHQQRLPPPRPYAPEQTQLVGCPRHLLAGNCCPSGYQPWLLLPGPLSGRHASTALTGCHEGQKPKLLLSSSAGLLWHRPVF